MSVEPKKRRNKAKVDELNKNNVDEIIFNVNNETVEVEDVSVDTALPKVATTLPNIGNEVESDVDVLKKRGRKARGAKLVSKPQTTIFESPPTVLNIILHLKCCLADLNEYNKEINNMISDPLLYNPSIPPDITGYNDNVSAFSSFATFNKDETGNAELLPMPERKLEGVDICLLEKLNGDNGEKRDKGEKESNEPTMKEINAKLKKLKIALYKNELNDKKSACFWCCYDFDNVPCCIPKHELNDTIHGYGSFCRPECAVAYLFKENIDDSVRFERYYLLNSIYAKVYNYNQNIKPAPDPHYLLEKFYGNLTIQEYRKLLNSQHLLLCLEKPMTRVLPEIHDDNDNFTSKTGIYKVKRESERQQGPTKNTIMRERFGIH